MLGSRSIPTHRREDRGEMRAWERGVGEEKKKVRIVSVRAPQRNRTNRRLYTYTCIHMYTYIHIHPYVYTHTHKNACRHVLRNLFWGIGLHICEVGKTVICGGVQQARNSGKESCHRLEAECFLLEPEFLFWRPSVEWIRPPYVMKGNLLYLHSAYGSW